MQGQLEAGAAGPRVAVALVLGQAHGLEPLGQRQRVAVVAARRRPVAARGRVPGGLGPLDPGPVSHERSPRLSLRLSLGRHTTRSYVRGMTGSSVSPALVDLAAFVDRYPYAF